MDPETVIIFVTVACAAVPWAFSIHGKVAIIATAMQSLPQLLARIEQHEERLNLHEKEIKRLADKEATRSSH